MATPNVNVPTVIDQDGAAILDIERGLLCTLNPTGAFVWQRLRCGESIETIIAGLARETGEDALVVESDVRDFIGTLELNRLWSH